MDLIKPYRKENMLIIILNWTDSMSSEPSLWITALFIGPILGVLIVGPFFEKSNVEVVGQECVSFFHLRFGNVMSDFLDVPSGVGNANFPRHRCHSGTVRSVFVAFTIGKVVGLK